MSCNKCGNKKCGCKDTALTTIPQFQCPPGDCPVPPVCSEVFDSRCVTYQGADIEDLPITNGMSVQAIIQMFTLLNTNASAVTGSCKATFNIFPAEISSTYLTIGWDPSSTATSYVLEYKEASSLIWLAFPSQTTTVGVIPNLTPNTIYNVRVQSNCAGPSSNYSVTISVKTKA